MERTLIILKPDTVARGLIGEITSRFERAGLKIVGIKMAYPDMQHLHKHYEGVGSLLTRKGQAIFDTVLDSMSVGPVVAMVIEGVEVVSLVRKMVGDTEPKSALPGTIRGDYSHMSYSHSNKVGVGIPNIVHASADEAEAKLEIPLWFGDDEIFSYENVHEKFTQPKKK
jgi:nucleoside-diphosphate kinase